MERIYKIDYVNMQLFDQRQRGVNKKTIIS